VAITSKQQRKKELAEKNLILQSFLIGLQIKSMMINWTWFNNEEIEEPSYEERIFFCNQENDQILEFKINPERAKDLMQETISKAYLEYDD
jgi:hypothetical protein